jgi:hypothetical protein
MSQSIDVDDEVYERLKEEAEPFVDTPNSVLRRLLRLDPSVPGLLPSALTQREGPEPTATTANGARPRRTPRGDKRSSALQQRKTRGERKRVPPGSILPEEEYEMPLLQSLVDAGGSGFSREIVEAVGKRLGSRLTEIDRQPLNSGAIRWENRIQFVRLKLIERGWMVRDAPRGTWAISDEGRKHIEENSK